jgi:hypothetical protein
LEKIMKNEWGDQLEWKKNNKPMLCFFFPHKPEWEDQLWNWKWFGKNHEKQVGRSTGMKKTEHEFAN